VSQSDLVTVGWAYGQAEAALVSALLGASGIGVFPHSWYVASVQWHWTHALGGIELKVPASQAGDAIALLAACPIARRPRPWPWRLLVAVVATAILVSVSVPPPAAGFFIAGRPGALRQQEPV
jgi:hypothetical protein